METEKGYRIKLETIPVGGGETGGLWFSVFEDDPRDAQPKPQSAAQKPSGDSDGDLPF
jgi:hypothetical protein